MFDLPEAKRVRRGDLMSHSSSSSLDLEGYEKAVQARLRNLFSIDATSPGPAFPADLDDDPAIDTVKEDALEFRLFTAPKGDRASLQGHETSRITIRSPSPDQYSSGVLIAPRPDSYYFTTPLPQNDLEKIMIAAISGEDVLHESKRRWPGSELPWRLVTLQAERRGKSKEFQGSSLQAKTSSSHTRGGKKRRIATRKKAAAIKFKQEQAALEKVAKEAAEKAKRTQRNREKKVKKKARDKAKKSGTSSFPAEVADIVKQPPA